MNKAGGRFSFLYKRKMLRVSLKWRLCLKSDVSFQPAFDWQEATMLSAMVGAGAPGAGTGT